MADVAMFPLGSVLFPHTPLVLRVFEPRYLTMVGRLLDEEDPSSGSSSSSADTKPEAATSAAVSARWRA